jgi:hypothetical protein
MQYVDSEIDNKIASALDLIDNSIIPKLGWLDGPIDSRYIM